MMVWLTSSTVTSLSRTKVRSEIDPVMTGTLMALPSKTPSRLGMVLAVAAAAPVDVGMMF